MAADRGQRSCVNLFTSIYYSGVHTTGNYYRVHIIMNGLIIGSIISFFSFLLLSFRYCYCVSDVFSMHEHLQVAAINASLANVFFFSIFHLTISMQPKIIDRITTSMFVLNQKPLTQINPPTKCAHDQFKLPIPIPLLLAAQNSRRC